MNEKKITPTSLQLLIQRLHQHACEEGADYYLDPKTGYRVFTADYLRKTGKCCDSGCRHCPYRKPELS